MSHLPLLFVAAVTISAIQPAGDTAQPPSAPQLNTRISNPGLNTEMTNKFPGGGSGGGGTAGGGGSVGAPRKPQEYVHVPACAGNTPENGGKDICSHAADMCKNATSGPGYLAWVFARDVGTTPWNRVGETCYPDALIADAATQLTLADIQREFANTPFASPTATIQPPGGQTLITLPIYYSTTWTPTGFRPEQTRTLTLLGHTVDLRIKLASYTYSHGDGTTTGPTTSPGGPYPDGDVRHAYAEPGTYTPTLTATLTADYRVDGGTWAPINGTATRTTTLPAITALSATNHLTP